MLLPPFCSFFFLYASSLFPFNTRDTGSPKLQQNFCGLPISRTELERGIIAIQYFVNSNNGETRPRAVVFLSSEPHTKSDKVKLCRQSLESAKSVFVLERHVNDFSKPPVYCISLHSRPFMGTFLLPVGKRQLNTINGNENLTPQVSVRVFRDLLNENPCGNVQCNKTLIDRRQEPLP